MSTRLAELEGFASGRTGIRLPVRRIAPGRRFLRLMKATFTDPVGCGVGASRFSDPRLDLLDAAQLYRVVYCTADAATAFAEVVLRDRTDGRLPPHRLSKRYVTSFHIAELEVLRELVMVDLSTDTARRVIGLPTDVVRASDHAASQTHALALHAHQAAPDGILYPSRFIDGAVNLAVFDRALASGILGHRPVALSDGQIAAFERRFGIEVVDVPDSAAADVIV